DVLGVEPLPERRRADEVGEEHRDDAPLLLVSARRRAWCTGLEGGAAARAERGSGLLLRATRRAGAVERGPAHAAEAVAFACLGGARDAGECHAPSLDPSYAASRTNSPSRSGRASTCAGCGLMKVAAMTAPRTRSPARTDSPTRNPWSTATMLVGATPCPSANAVVEAAAIALTAASPMAPPIWRLVLTSPDATPASARPTPERLAIVTGTNEKPIPAPPRTKAGKRAQKYWPAIGSRGSRATDTADGRGPDGSVAR